jgi:hypothetical protein
MGFISPLTAAINPNTHNTSIEIQSAKWLASRGWE